MVILVVMAVIEEFIIVVIYLVAGFTMDKQTPDHQGPLVFPPWKERRQDTG